MIFGKTYDHVQICYRLIETSKSIFGMNKHAWAMTTADGHTFAIAKCDFCNVNTEGGGDINIFRRCCQTTQPTLLTPLEATVTTAQS